MALITEVAKNATNICPTYMYMIRDKSLLRNEQNYMNIWKRHSLKSNIILSFGMKQM